MKGVSARKQISKCTQINREREMNMQQGSIIETRVESLVNNVCIACRRCHIYNCLIKPALERLENKKSTTEETIITIRKNFNDRNNKCYHKLLTFEEELMVMEFCEIIKKNEKNIKILKESIFNVLLESSELNDNVKKKIKEELFSDEYSGEINVLDEIIAII